MASTVYCPRCGTQMERRFTEGRDRDVCPACGHILYRNPVPAVGVVVALEGKVVLVRRKFAPCIGHWALPAGYMELGESAEDAAVRECHEETNLLIQVDHLLGVYSFGLGDESGLVIIYAATAVGGYLRAGDDATEADIFDPDSLHSPMAFHTHIQAIDKWKYERRFLQGTLYLPDVQQDAVVVRYAGDEDIKSLLVLLRNELPQDDEQSLVSDTLLRDWLYDPDRQVLVAEFEGVIAGLSVLSFYQTLRGWYALLEELVVEPAFRRRGIGTILIKTALYLAQSRRCRALHFAMASQTGVEPSFLATQGFVAEGVWTRSLLEIPR
ncbi:MAG: GNAT family N-acetyltransferase [Chloroflexota bacterium]